MRLDVPSARPTQARIRPMPAVCRKSSTEFHSAAIGIYQCDAKHSLFRECVLQHRAISRFKDVEREKRVGKKDRARERHHRDRVWK